MFTPDVSAWFFETTEQRCQLLRSWARQRPNDVTVRAPDAGPIRPVQPQGSGSGAIVRARAVTRVPVGMTGTFASSAALSVGTSATAPAEHRQRRPPFTRATTLRLPPTGGTCCARPSRRSCAGHKLVTRRGVRS